MLPRRISTAGGAGSFSPEMELNGRVNESCTPSPAWRAARSLIAAGIGGVGGTGSPGAPHPAETRQMERKNGKRVNSGKGSVTDEARVAFPIVVFNRIALHR